jgi:PHD/YefM family antitoxin component YafN of YafNO toxin-antitoxin module
MYIVSREGNCVTTISAGKARMSLCRLIDQAAETHEIIRISGKTRNAILVSEEKWNTIQETLYLYADPEIHKSIKDSMNAPLTKCGRRLK